MNREEQRATIESRIETMVVAADRTEYLLAHWCIVMLRSKSRDLDSELGKTEFDIDMQHADSLLTRYKAAKAETTTTI